MHVMCIPVFGNRCCVLVCSVNFSKTFYFHRHTGGVGDSGNSLENNTENPVVFFVGESDINRAWAMCAYIIYTINSTHRYRNNWHDNPRASEIDSSHKIKKKKNRSSGAGPVRDSIYNAVVNKMLRNSPRSTTIIYMTRGQ